MASLWKHLPAQRRVIASLGRTLGLTALERIRTRGKAARAVNPDRVVEARVRAPSAALVEDFLSWSGAHPGADSRSGRPEVPPSLFPQWGVPSFARAIERLPYPLTRVLNAGCRYRVHAPIPCGAPLNLRARLLEVDEGKRRLIARVRLETRSERDALLLDAELQVIVPLRRSGTREGEAPGAKKKEKPVVPEAATRIATLSQDRRAGRDFAFLTGDFNPVHWVRPYARLAGFPSVILHGFGSLAQVVPHLEAEAGCPLREVEVRFTRPLVLPAKPGLFVLERRLMLADGVGQVPYLDGQFDLV